MGGKGSAPAAPDYTPIAASDAATAQMQYNLGQQQLQWGQQQFNTEWPYAQQYLQQQTASSAAATNEAQQQEGIYNNTFEPIVQNFADEAKNYNSPAQATANAGGAMADVSDTYNSSRQSALSSLESYGIDPSQTRYAALDLSSRVSQAAATAAAGTQSRQNTQATGLALQGEAVNMGQGMQNNVAQSYATAQNAGSSGINTANNTVSTGSGSMGSPTSYMGLGNQSMMNQTAALNTGFNNQISSAQLNNQENSNTMNGIGSLIGGGLALGALAL